MADSYQYDVAISFARDSRPTAREVAERLRAAGIKVFFDEYLEHELWGVNGREAFTRIFGSEARYCLVLISKEYDRRAWTTLEREILESRELGDRSNFLLPVMTDDHRPSWLLASRIYFDLPARGLDELVDLVRRRVGSPVFVGRMNEGQLASLTWLEPVGIGTWKTAPVATSDRVFFPGAGMKWNKPDLADGIACLERSSGRRLWLASTDGDANAVLLDDSRLFVGTDLGFVYCFDAVDGRQLWVRTGRGAILARPLLTPAGLLVCTAGGELLLLDPRSGASVGEARVQGAVFSDPIINGDWIYVATYAGWLYRLPLERPLARVGRTSGESILLTYPSRFEAGGRAPCSVGGSAVVLEDLVIFPFSRITDFQGVPLTAVDPVAFVQVWDSASGPRDNYGNVRSNPVVADGCVVVPVAYGNEVVAVDGAGGVRWTCGAGRSFFPQWGSAGVHGKDVLVPRFDGFVHAINSESGRRRWSMYLGNESEAGKYFDEQETLPGQSADPEWENAHSSPLNSPALVDSDDAFIVSAEGIACRVSLTATSSTVATW